MNIANNIVIEPDIKTKVKTIIFLGTFFIGVFLLTKFKDSLMFYDVLEALTIISGAIIPIVAYKGHKKAYSEITIFIMITYIFISTVYLFHALSMRQIGFFSSVTLSHSMGFLLSSRFIEGISILCVGAHFYKKRDLKKTIYQHSFIVFFVLIAISYLSTVIDFILPNMEITPSYKIFTGVLFIIFMMSMFIPKMIKESISKEALLYLSIAIYVAAFREGFSMYVFTLGEIVPISFENNYFFYHTLGNTLRLTSYYYIFKALNANDFQQSSREKMCSCSYKGLEKSCTKEYRQEHLQKQEVLLQKVINSLVEAIVLINNEGEIIHYNINATNLFSIPSFLAQKRDITILYRYIQNFLVEPDKLNREIKEAYLYNKDISEEVFLKDGRCIKVYITSFEVYNTKGWVLSLEDITVDKRQRILIEESQKKYEKLLNAIPNAMVVQKNMICIYANEAAVTLFGYNSQEELIGSNLRQFLPDEHLESLENGYQDGCFKHSLEFKVLNNNQNQRWAKVVSYSDYQEEDTKLIIFEDITIKKSKMEMEKTMEEKQRVLEKQRVENEFKIDFYTNFSHELKTPINIISAIGHLLKKELQENSPKTLEYLNTLNANCNRLIRNINNSIDINKLETGFYQLNKQYCNIVTIVEEVVQSAIPYMEKKGLQCIFDTDEEEILTRIDINSMERIILNLLSNAIKFTPPKGQIGVKVSRLGRDFKVIVQDSGIGIKKEKFTKIFRRFEQGDQSLEHNPRGSGIGLYLTKNLIEMHGGRIIVESEVGKGSTFKVILPIEEMKPTDQLVDIPTLMMNRLDPKEIANVEMSELYY